MPLPDKLTVYNLKGTQITKSEPWHMVNLALLGVFVLMLFIYVMQMNSITSRNYQIKLLNGKISSLNESNSVLSVSKSAIDDLDAIESFAKANNMIKSDGSVAMYGDTGVAIQR
jgi:hypothetical protein